jgi:hypothetical protein
MTAEEIKVLGDSEMETGRSVATMLGIVSVAFLVILGGFSIAVLPNLLPLVLFLVVGLGAAAATGVMFWAWRRRNGIIATFMSYKLPALRPAPPATAPATAPEIKIVDVQSSRGGESARKIHGFELATLAWVCDSLAQGALWTEAALEKYTVPHMQPPTLFGKARGDTPYNRLFNSETGLFIRAGIIVGRTERFSGKLAITTPLEMLHRIKELPELEPTP